LVTLFDEESLYLSRSFILFTRLRARFGRQRRALSLIGIDMKLPALNPHRSARHRLYLALVAALLSIGAHAQSAAKEARDLDAVIVTATPLKEDAESILAPVSVLSGTALDDQRRGTIGETVARLPGVQSSFFGIGVGRPIIRGLDSGRVSVLSGGLSSMDVSTVSADHAVSIDPFLAEQIEVIKGPASLLYGSGAIGGVVNVVDGRIPIVVREGLSGRASVQGDTASDQRAGAFRVDHGGMNGWNLHADGYWRDSDDYKIPKLDAGKSDDDSGRLENSAVESKGGALGGAWQGEDVHFGLGVSTFKSTYGIPGEEEADDDKSKLRSWLPAKGGEGGVVLDIDQTRIDLEAAWQAPIASVQSATFKLGRNDYQHAEIEGSGEIGTQFDNQETDARLELVHTPWGAWTGAYGVTLNGRKFEAIGEEAFVPPTDSRSYGAFILEQTQLDAVKLEIGARYDRNRLSTATDRRSFGLFSLSAGARADLGNQFSLGLLFDRAQRAPSAEELFADGPHVATRTFEIGDADLSEETANQIEAEFRFEGATLHLHASIYRNDFKDFIYLTPNGSLADGLPVLLWSQGDARFNGYELGAEWEFANTDFGIFTLDALADSVDGELQADRSNLPRIAPSRVGMGLQYQHEGWRARLGFQEYERQDRVAELETPTPGFTDVTAQVSFATDLSGTSVEWFLQGQNLADNEIRLHTSFLKDVAPLPGRNIQAGVRWYF